MNSSIIKIKQRNFIESVEAVNVITILDLKLVLNACLASRVRERTCIALKANNRSDFPKGSDTSTEINCTVLRMNKGIFAVIKEARALPPCRPEQTLNKPTAVPARLMDSASMESLTANTMPTHTHFNTSPAQKYSYMHICTLKCTHKCVCEVER